MRLRAKTVTQLKQLTGITFGRMYDATEVGRYYEFTDDHGSERRRTIAGIGSHFDVFPSPMLPQDELSPEDLEVARQIIEG